MTPTTFSKFLNWERRMKGAHVEIYFFTKHLHFFLCLSVLINLLNVLNLQMYRIKLAKSREASWQWLSIIMSLEINLLLYTLIFNFMWCVGFGEHCCIMALCWINRWTMLHNTLQWDRLVLITATGFRLYSCHNAVHCILNAVCLTCITVPNASQYIVCV